MSIIHQFITINEHQRIGEIILDNPKSLNAQTYDMVKTTSELLSTWADDASVVAVLMRGAGQKAFCAGGDIRGLYHAYNSEIFPNPKPKVRASVCGQHPTPSILKTTARRKKPTDHTISHLS